jgi:hypothetical protein
MNRETLPAQGPVDVNVMPHTRGPWEVAAGDNYRIEASAIPAEYPHLFQGDDLGRMVAMVGNRQPDFGAADAALIAAAPEMFEALQAVVDFIGGKPDAPEPFGMVRAAIAKALGHEA